MSRLTAALILPFAMLALSTAQAAPAKKEPADPNKVRCKSQVETGSLVKRNKICRTEDEWRRATEAARHETQTMQTSVGGQNPN